MMISLSTRKETKIDAALSCEGDDEDELPNDEGLGGHNNFNDENNEDFFFFFVSNLCSKTFTTGWR